MHLGMFMFAFLLWWKLFHKVTPEISQNSKNLIKRCQFSHIFPIQIAFKLIITRFFFFNFWLSTKDTFSFENDQNGYSANSLSLFLHFNKIRKNRNDRNPPIQFLRRKRETALFRKIDRLSASRSHFTFCHSCKLFFFWHVSQNGL